MNSKKTNTQKSIVRNVNRLLDTSQQLSSIAKRINNMSDDSFISNLLPFLDADAIQPLIEITPSQKTRRLRILHAKRNKILDILECYHFVNPLEEDESLKDYVLDEFIDNTNPDNIESITDFQLVRYYYEHMFDEDVGGGFKPDYIVYHPDKDPLREKETYTMHQYKEFLSILRNDKSKLFRRFCPQTEEEAQQELCYEMLQPEIKDAYIQSFRKLIQIIMRIS